MKAELGQIEQASSSSPAIIDFDFNENDLYDHEFPDLDLDDNGFPSFPPSKLHFNEDDENDHDDDTFLSVRSRGTHKETEDVSVSVTAKQSIDSFASEFYRCGTDCSSLLLNQKSSVSERKSLKQRDLFQLWGLKKPTEAVSVDVLHSTPNKKIKVNIIRDFASSPDSGNYSSELKSSGKRKWSNVGSGNRPRVCPFYKKLLGTFFTVDAFRYGNIEGCKAYFLTHFHADHYGGLTKGWSHGPIYCTPITARLLRICINVNPQFIHPLELDTEHVIEGIRVTMLEANHCPGAALVHFRLPNGQCYLHTGDFRASKLMQTYPLLLNRRVNVLYLDTTYLHPKHTFPSKDDVLSFVVKVTKNGLQKQPKTLVVVGAYSIGKECVYLSISKALGVKVFAVASRRRVLQSFGWPELSGNLCASGKDTPLHVLPISHLRVETLQNYLKTYKDQYKAVLAFRPTGWTYSQTVGNQLDLIKPLSRGNVTIYGVPYSEHSSFPEMKEFVQFLKPEKIIPTVNVGNAATREMMQSTFQEWLRG